MYDISSLTIAATVADSIMVTIKLIVIVIVVVVLAAMLLGGAVEDAQTTCRFVSGRILSYEKTSLDSAVSPKSKLLQWWPILTEMNPEFCGKSIKWYTRCYMKFYSQRLQFTDKLTRKLARKLIKFQVRTK